MYDYIATLYQQFFRGLDFIELKKDVERTRREARDCLNKEKRRKLLHLVDLQNLVWEEITLAVLLRVSVGLGHCERVGISRTGGG